MKKELLVAIQSGDWYDESNDEKSMEYARDIGIEGLDFSIDHLINPAEYLKGKVFPLCDKPIDEFLLHYSSLKRASNKYDVEIAQMHAPFPTWHEDANITDYMISVTEKVCALCEYLDCPALVIHPNNCKDKAERIRTNLQMYERLIPAAKKHNVTICLENLLAMNGDEIIGGVCSDSEEAKYLIDTLNDKADCEIFGLCFDVGHANASGIRLSKYMKDLGKRITALHIHDNNGKSDAHLIPYTQIRDQWGIELGVDWKDFIDGLIAIDYKKCISFETFRATNNLPKEVEKQALSLILNIGKYFRNIIESKN